MQPLCMASRPCVFVPMRPLNSPMQVKKMNLESMNCDLDEIIHEAQLMKNYNHPNVLPLHTSFVAGQDLWMVMPFISGGSVLHIIKYAHPEVSTWIHREGKQGGEGRLLRSSARALSSLAGPGGDHRGHHHARGAQGPRVCAQAGRHSQGYQGVEEGLVT